MVHLVLAALFLAVLANLGAGFADKRDHAAVTRHAGRRETTDFRTVDVQRNAFGHGIDVGFVQAGVGTTVASQGAGLTGGDAGFEVGFRHQLLLERWRESVGEQGRFPFPAQARSTERIPAHLGLFAGAAYAKLL